MNCGSCSVYAIELNISEIPEWFVSTLAPPAAEYLTRKGFLNAVGEACEEKSYFQIIDVYVYIYSFCYVSRYILYLKKSLLNSLNYWWLSILPHNN